MKCLTYLANSSFGWLGHVTTGHIVGHIARLSITSRSSLVALPAFRCSAASHSSYAISMQLGTSRIMWSRIRLVFGIVMARQVTTTITPHVISLGWTRILDICRSDQGRVAFILCLLTSIAHCHHVLVVLHDLLANLFLYLTNFLPHNSSLLLKCSEIKLVGLRWPILHALLKGRQLSKIVCLALILKFRCKRNDILLLLLLYGLGVDHLRLSNLLLLLNLLIYKGISNSASCAINQQLLLLIYLSLAVKTK